MHKAQGAQGETANATSWQGSTGSGSRLHGGSWTRDQSWRRNEHASSFEILSMSIFLYLC